MIKELAWKNIWRNKTRSLIIIMAMTISMGGGIFISSVLKGMFSQRIYNALHIEIPDIKVTKKKFLENNDILLQITDVDKHISEIEKIPGVVSASKRITLTSMIATAHNSVGVTAYGIDPEKEKEIFDLYKTIPDTLGTFLSKDQRAPIVIGKKLADKLKSKTKSKTVLTFQSIDEDLTGGAFRVSGIYTTSNSAMDESTVFINYQDAAELAGITDCCSHEIIVLVKDNSEVGAIKKQIEALVGSQYETQTWSQIRPDVGVLVDLMDLMSVLILVIILITLGFSITNTMFMVVHERTKEIGMLLAIGMGKLKVFTMILWETVILTVLGGVLGILLSTLIVIYFSKEGIDIGSGYSIVGVENYIYPTLSINDYVQICMLIFFTGIIAALFPSRRALKLKPAEVIRN